MGLFIFFYLWISAIAFGQGGSESTPTVDPETRNEAIRVSCDGKGGDLQIILEPRAGELVAIYNSDGQRIARVANARFLRDVNRRKVCDAIRSRDFATKALTSNLKDDVKLDGKPMVSVTTLDTSAGIGEDGAANTLPAGNYYLALNDARERVQPSAFFERDASGEYQPRPQLNHYLAQHSYREMSLGGATRSHDIDRSPMFSQAQLTDLERNPVKFMSSPICDCSGRCRISSEFGTRSRPATPRGPGSREHGGTDFAGPCNQPVLTTADGRVTSINYNAGNGCGIYVVVEHAPGVETKYCHLQPSPQVKVGDPLTRGNLLGRIGRTGVASGCNLHLIVTINGRPRNPLQYLDTRNQGINTTCSALAANTQPARLAGRPSVVSLVSGAIGRRLRGSGVPGAASTTDRAVR
jgi:murein DD-endopeptidase MepM/ murein hydrolase activator NlpD